MADTLTLINKQNHNIPVFVVPVGSIPIKDHASNKKYLWSFYSKHSMSALLYYGIILSAANKNDAYAMFLKLLRDDTVKSYHYEETQWYFTCEGEDNYPEREQPVLLAAMSPG